VALTFTTSKTFSGLNATPDMRGLTVHGTSGSTEGGNVNYYGDGIVTSGGVVVLDSPTSTIDIGLDYTVTIKTLPVNAQVANSGALTGKPRKIAKAILELSSCYNVKVNTMDVLINNISNLDTSTTLTAFTGKKDVHFLGYSNEPTIEITQSVPLPLRLLGITTEIYY
jgi:hypothetical protein